MYSTVDNRNVVQGLLVSTMIVGGYIENTRSKTLPYGRENLGLLFGPGKP
jgi:hypothetical protein